MLNRAKLEIEDSNCLLLIQDLLNTNMYEIEKEKKNMQ